MVRKLVPNSIAARGAVLVVLVAVAVALPAILVQHLLVASAQARLEYERDTFLGLALAAQLENRVAMLDGDTDGEIAWLEALRQQSGRIRWAAVLDHDGKGFEFRRRTELSRDQIVAQINLNATAPELRPLLVDGERSERFELLTVPHPAQQALYAVVMDRIAGQPVGDYRLALAFVGGMVGLLLAFLWLQTAIARPIRRFGATLRGTAANLTDLSLASMTPTELTGLMESTLQTQRELAEWRGTATNLKLNVEHRVNARTRKAELAQLQAEKAADTDALTHLGNRRLLERELPGWIEDRRRVGGELSLILIDVDHFKTLNDTAGHQAGDTLLGFLGQLIHASIRHECDHAIRFGGDEFVIVLPDTGVRAACAVAERLVALFAQRARTFDYVEPRPGLSVGVATMTPEQPCTADELLHQADAAMYYAKRNELAVATSADLRDAQALPE